MLKAGPKLSVYQGNSRRLNSLEQFNINLKERCILRTLCSTALSWHQSSQLWQRPLYPVHTIRRMQLFDRARILLMKLILSKNDRYGYGYLSASHLTEGQEEPSKIGASVYRGADYNDYLGTVDDLTQTLGKSFNPQNDATASSFQLLHRGLQGQEQLDISTGETCDVFIYSYLPGTLPDCYNWATFRCMRLWDNPGL